MLRSLDQYFLFQAYELLGERLFGPEWTGGEYSLRALKVLAPEQLEARRQSIETKIADRNRQIASHRERIRRSVNAEEIASAQQNEKREIEARSRLDRSLFDLPRPDDSYRKDFAALQRHLTAENHLIQALRKSEIVARAGFGMLIPAEKWDSASGFKFHIELSLVIFPRDFANHRRGSVTFPRPEYEAWLGQQIPVVPDESNPVAPDVQCRNYLRGAVGVGKTMSRDEYRDEALRRFPGLSERRFRQLWSEVVPLDFKLPGRRKGRKKLGR